MKMRIVSRIIVGVSLVFLSVQHTQARDFTDDEVDETIIRSLSHSPDFQKFAAVSQQVYYSSIIENPKSPDERKLAIAMGQDVWGDSRPPIFMKTEPLESKLKKAADAASARFDPVKIRGTWIDIGIDAGLAGVGILSKNPNLVGVLAPPIKEGIIRRFEKEGEKPNFSNTFTREWVKWGIAQCRKGNSAEGAALGGLCEKLEGGSLYKNPRNHPAIASAKAIAQGLENGEKLDGILKRTGLIEEQLTQIAQSKAPDAGSADAAAADRALTVRNFQNFSGGLTIASAALRLAGKEEDSQLVGSMADATSGIANLIQNASQMAPLMLVGGYVAIGMAVISAVQARKQKTESPYPKIFEMLAVISKKLDELKTEMRSQFADLDSEVGGLLSREFQLTQAIKSDTTQIIEKLSEIEKLLRDIDKSFSNQFADLAQLLLSDQDLNCFSRTGGGDILPLQERQAFIKCRDTYVNRAVKFGRSEIAQKSGTSSVNSQRLLSLGLPYDDQYEFLRQAVGPQALDLNRSLTHPGIWLASSGSLVTLIGSNPDHFRDIAIKENNGNLQSADLDPVIEDGVDLIKLVENVAVVRNTEGARLREKAFSNIVDRIFESYQYAVTRIQGAASSFELKLDPTQGIEQAINRDFKFMLLNRSIPFCQGVNPTFTNFLRIGFSKFGGSNGILSFHDAVALHPSVYNVNVKLIQDELAKLDRGIFTVDNTFMLSIPSSIVLQEQVKHKEAVLSACIANFVVSDLYQDSATSKMKLDVAFNVNLKRTEQTSAPEKLIYKMSKTYDVEMPYAYPVFSNPRKSLIVNRTNTLVTDGWRKLSGRFGQLTHLKDTQTDTDRASASKSFEISLNEARAKLRDSLIQTMSDNNRKLRADIRALEAISLVGLNASHPGVSTWLRVIKSGHLSVDLDSLVRMGLADVNARPAANLSATIQTSKKVLNDGISALSKFNDLSPPTSPIKGHVALLNRIKTSRGALVENPQ